jgi:hypothetical protein
MSDSNHVDRNQGSEVADAVFVLLTVLAFAVLALTVRAGQRLGVPRTLWV